MKEFTITYGNDTYTKLALSGENLIYLGGKLAPKVVGFGQTINTLINRSFIENENHYSIYQCIKDIFAVEDWKWLVEAILYDFDRPIAVGKRYLATKEEVDEHFAGDFVRMATVVVKMAYKNLGEPTGLMKGLSTSMQNIMSCLIQVCEAYVNEVQQSINSYGKAEGTTKNSKSKQKKK